MSINWTDAKTWQEKGGAATTLVALRKQVQDLEPQSAAEMLPQVLAFLAAQRRGVGFLFDAFLKINKYNEASHEQQARQADALRSLMAAFHEQDRVIRKLTKRVDSLEKQLGKLSAKVAAKKPSRG
jgi:putative protein kinase ArgK-like GTPase of G3E family